MLTDTVHITGRTNLTFCCAVSYWYHGPIIRISLLRTRTNRTYARGPLSSVSRSVFPHMDQLDLPRSVCYVVLWTIGPHCHALCARTNEPSPVCFTLANRTYISALRARRPTGPASSLRACPYVPTFVQGEALPLSLLFVFYSMQIRYH